MNKNFEIFPKKVAEIRGLFRFWWGLPWPDQAILGSQASFWHIFPKTLGFHKILSGNADLFSSLYFYKTDNWNSVLTARSVRRFVTFKVGVWFGRYDKFYVVMNRLNATMHRKPYWLVIAPPTLIHFYNDLFLFSLPAVWPTDVTCLQDCFVCMIACLHATWPLRSLTWPQRSPVGLDP